MLAWAFPQSSTGRTARRFLAQICASAEYTMIAGLSLELINSICNDINKQDQGGGQAGQQHLLPRGRRPPLHDARRVSLGAQVKPEDDKTTTTTEDNDQDARSKLMKSAGFKELMQAVDSCSKDDF